MGARFHRWEDADTITNGQGASDVFGELIDSPDGYRASGFPSQRGARCAPRIFASVASVMFTSLPLLNRLA